LTQLVPPVMHVFHILLTPVIFREFFGASVVNFGSKIIVCFYLLCSNQSLYTSLSALSLLVSRSSIIHSWFLILNSLH
jgi:hypothetical protein